MAEIKLTAKGRTDRGKNAARRLRREGLIPAVVYGGGLEEENAKMISNIPAIDGGLVALTRFTGDIGFYPDELRSIIDKYLE